MMDKILLVDDDKILLEVIKYNLVKDNFEVITAADGIQALSQADSERPDLIILDLMLPGLDGLEVCRALRKKESVPILMLTAKTEEVDKVLGLEMGADDYLTKPFSMRELIARVHSTLRRSQRIPAETKALNESGPPVTTKAGDFEVDSSKREIYMNGRQLQLSFREFEILAFLMRHLEQVFSRSSLIEKLWGYEYAGTERTVDVHIRSLRRKIEDNPNEPQHLINIRCVGYKFEVGNS